MSEQDPRAALAEELGSLADLIRHDLAERGVLLVTEAAVAAAIDAALTERHDLGLLRPPHQARIVFVHLAALSGEQE